VLREVEGYSHAEIAALLDIREGTSQVRHHRAVRMLLAWTTEARARMRDILLREGTRKSVRGATRVTSLDGREVKLAALTTGRPTVVTFWSRYCGPSLMELPAVESLSRALEARGIGFVAITDEAPSNELRTFLAERKLTFPVYLDTRREATNGLNNCGTPNYYVLDAEGIVRFDQREIETVVRNASLLLPDHRPNE
jgi:thiol-disulfide isomerase/thioredoxin